MNNISKFVIISSLLVVFCIESSSFATLGHDSQSIQEGPIRRKVRLKQSFNEAKKVTKAAAIVAAYPLIGIGAYCFRDSLPQIPPAIQEGMATGGSIVAAISAQSFTKPLTDNGKFILSKLNLASPTEQATLQSKYYELEEEFAVREHTMSDDVRSEISNDLKDIQTRINFHRENNSWNKDEIKKKLDRITAIFNLPIHPFQIANAQQSRKQLQEQLSTYSVDIQNKAQEILTRLEAGVRPENYFKNIKATYYLQGEPGTGKTSFARALAKAAGLPFCEVRLAALSPKDLLGSRSEGNEPLKPGKIAECLSQKDPLTGKAGTNPIIFIDEAHDVLNTTGPERQNWFQLIKLLTEGNTTKIRDDGLGVDLDISHATIILAGNEPLTDQTGALNSRLDVVHFPNLTFEQKRIVGLNFLKEQCKVYDYPCSDVDREWVLKRIEEDQTPGARAMQGAITTYILAKKTFIETGHGQDFENPASESLRLGKGHRLGGVGKRSRLAFDSDD